MYYNAVSRLDSLRPAITSDWNKEKPPKNLNILLVEDSLSDVYLIEELLETAFENRAYCTSSVSRLTDAFNLIKYQSFDIVFLDLNLLDLQGVSCVQALHAEIPNTPIIVLSGMDDPILREQCILAGATDYQVKGLQTPGILKSVIKEAIDK